MRLREFFERLPKDGWWLSDKDEIRRGAHGDMECQCPISSIDDSPWYDFESVAEEHGINERLTNWIIAAAEDLNIDDLSCRWLRRLLLAHCGLSEPQ